MIDRLISFAISVFGFSIVLLVWLVFCVQLTMHYRNYEDSYLPKVVDPAEACTGEPSPILGDDC